MTVEQLKATLNRINAKYDHIPVVVEVFRDGGDVAMADLTETSLSLEERCDEVLRLYISAHEEVSE